MPLTCPSKPAENTEPSRLPTPPTTTTRNAVHHHRRAHVGKHRLEARHHHARDPGEPGAVGERQRIDPLHVDAASRRHRRVAHDRADLDAERGAIHQQPRNQCQHQRDADDEAAECVDLHPTQTDGPGQRLRHAHVLQPGTKPRDMQAEERKAELQPNRLLQQDRHPPGGEQRIEQPAIQPAHHDPLDREPNQRRHDKGKRHRGKDVEVKIKPGHHGRVGAQHDHLAMRHVDHAHGPVGDRQPQRHQQQHRGQAQADEHDLEHRSAAPPVSLSAWRYRGPCRCRTDCLSVSP